MILQAQLSGNEATVRALQHLERVGLVGDLERRRGDDAAAAEGAGLVAVDARLEVGRALRAGEAEAAKREEG